VRNRKATMTIGFRIRASDTFESFGYRTACAAPRRKPGTSPSRGVQTNDRATATAALRYALQEIPVAFGGFAPRQFVVGSPLGTPVILVADYTRIEAPDLCPIGRP